MESVEQNTEHNPFRTCEEKGHHLNKVEVWKNGTHAYGTVQCGVCGKKSKYDYKFPVNPNVKTEKVYKVKKNGWWKVVNYDELVFDFEKENDEPNIQLRKESFIDKFKDIMKRWK